MQKYLLKNYGVSLCKVNYFDAEGTCTKWNFSKNQNRTKKRVKTKQITKDSRL